MDYFKDTTFVSNSMIKRLLQDRELFDLWMKGEYTYPTTPEMILGSYVHHNFLNELSGGLLGCFESFEYPVVDDFGDLRTKKGKAARDEIEKVYPGGEYIQKKDVQRGIELVSSLLESRFVKDYIQFHRDNFELEVETVQTGETTVVDDSGTTVVPIKGKMDIRLKDMDGIVRKIIDLKTTAEINKFHRSVWTYGYNSQAKHYAELEGLNLYENCFDFLVIAKSNHAIKVFETDSDDFIRGAEKAFNYGMRQFVKWKRGDLFGFNIEKL